LSADASTENVIATCADALFDAEAARRPIPPLTDRFPGLKIADAYGIQQRNVDRRVRAGQRVVGHKIGLTSRAMQEQFGVKVPDYGHLLDTMVCDDGAPLDLGELIDPRIEIEPAFVLGRRLAGPGVGVADVIAATDYVSLCFEIIDSRIIDWRIRLQDTVADNGSSARLVLNSRRASPIGLELDNLPAELELDDVLAERGNTRDILGHPANGVAWLANSIAEFGVALEPGHIVLPGTCSRSRRIWGCQRLTGRMQGLGEIELEVEGVPSVTGAGKP
jgi:2-keto-4-pentenoate hydratase